MTRCHVCGQNITAHDPSCRVVDNLRRFDRVYRRLSAEGRNDLLRNRLLEYLRLHHHVAAA